MSFWAYMVLQVAKRFTTFVVVFLIVLGVHGFTSCGLESGSIQVSFSCDFICVILTLITAFIDVFT